MSDPRLGGEFMVDTAINYGTGSAQQCNPAVAFDGNNYLVAWTDYRDTLSGIGVQVARVTPDGAVLDPEGILIDTTGGYPAIDFDGTNYLVVDYGAAIQGFRVSPAGKVLDSTAIVISSGEPYPSWCQALAFDGTNYLVVWEEIRDTLSQIYGARVTPGGAVLDTAEIAVGTGPYWLTCPAIAFDGTNFLVVWNDSRDSMTAFIRGALVSPAGQVLSSGFRIADESGADEQYGPTASSDGTNTLVVWQDFSLGLRGALVAKDGSVVDSGIALTPPSEAYQGPTSIYDGTDFFVAWKQYSPTDGIFASRVSRAGVPLDTPGVCIAAPGYWTESPATAFDGNRYFVTWDDDRYGFINIYGARLTRQMSLLDTAAIGISRGVNTQQGSSTAFDGTNYLVAWADNRDMAGAIFAARVSANGTDLDPEGIPVCTLQHNRGFTLVAFDGTNYLVTWADGRRDDSSDIYAARVTRDGNVLDPQGFPVAVGGNAHTLPVVAFGGAEYLVTWADVGENGLGIAIRGARVSPAGQVLDTVGITICDGPYGVFIPAVASNGTNWLAAWEDLRSGSYLGVFAARISPAGQVLDSGGFAIADGQNDQGYPALGSDGSDYLVAWERQVGSLLDIRGACVSGAGTLLDSFMVLPEVAPYLLPMMPSIAYDGTDYGVIWLDSCHNSVWSVYGARVSPSGTVVDTALVASPVVMVQYLANVNVASGAGGQMLCTYPSWTDVYQGRTYNTTRVWGRLGALAGVQEETRTAVSEQNGGTIVRGVLFLPEASSQEHHSLLDISGRKVMDLRSGANDVRALAPGVYFAAEGLGSRGQGLGRIRKVIITR